MKLRGFLISWANAAGKLADSGHVFGGAHPLAQFAILAQPGDHVVEAAGRTADLIAPRYRQVSAPDRQRPTLLAASAICSIGRE